MYPINLGKNSVHTVNMNIDKEKKLMFGKSSKIVHGNLGHYFLQYFHKSEEILQ